MLYWKMPEASFGQLWAVPDGRTWPYLRGRGEKGLPWIVKCGLTGISQQNC